MADGPRLVRAANLLDSVQTDAIEFLDLSNQLAILGVLAREKTAFALGLGENALPRETIEGLEGFARRYDLRWKMTEQPTKPAQREPAVPVYFVNELDRMNSVSHAPNVCSEPLADVGIRAADRWRRVVFTDFKTRQITALGETAGRGIPNRRQPRSIAVSHQSPNPNSQQS